jgi:hypothetical protein
MFVVSMIRRQEAQRRQETGSSQWAGSRGLSVQSKQGQGDRRLRVIGWEAQSWQVQETENSEQTGSGDRRIRVHGQDP